MITAEDIKQLLKLARTRECWIIFDDETEETAIPLKQWNDIYMQKERS